MNKVYKVVWCEKTQTMVAVSEFAKSKGKSSSKSQLATSQVALPHFRLAKIAVALMSMFGWQATMAADVQTCVFNSHSAELICNDGSKITADNQTITLFNDNSTYTNEPITIGSVAPSQPSISTFGATPQPAISTFAATPTISTFATSNDHVITGPGAQIVVDSSNGNTARVTDVTIGAAGTTVAREPNGKQSGGIAIGSKAGVKKNAQGLIVDADGNVIAQKYKNTKGWLLPDGSWTGVNNSAEQEINNKLVWVSAQALGTDSVAIGTNSTADTQGVALGQADTRESGVAIGNDDMDAVAKGSHGKPKWNSSFTKVGSASDFSGFEFDDSTQSFGNDKGQNYNIKVYDTVEKAEEDRENWVKTVLGRKDGGTGDFYTWDEIKDDAAKVAQVKKSAAIFAYNKYFNDSDAAKDYAELAGGQLVNWANVEDEFAANTDKRYKRTFASAGSTALGVQSQATGAISAAFGTGSVSKGDFSTAFGTGAYASKKNSVALGAGSRTDGVAVYVPDAEVHTYDEYGNIKENETFYYSQFAGGSANMLAGDQVSVGKIGFERQIKNLAPGRISFDSTDAVNGSQLAVVTATVQGSMGDLQESVDGIYFHTNEGNATKKEYYLTATGETIFKHTDDKFYTQPNGNGIVVGAGDVTAIDVPAQAVGNGKTNKGNILARAGATGNNAVTIGKNTKATDQDNIAIGSDARAGGYTQAQIDSVQAEIDQKDTLISAKEGGIVVKDTAIAEQQAIIDSTDPAVTNAQKADATKKKNELKQAKDRLAKQIKELTTEKDSLAVFKTEMETLQVQNAVTQASAFGNSSLTTVNGGVALGYGSVAERKALTNKSEAFALATATEADKNAIKATVKGNLGAVSVGTTEKTRQITNVAAGRDDSDAVNVAQLKAVANTGLIFGGNDTDKTKDITRKLGEKLTIKGGHSKDEVSDKNLYVKEDTANNTLIVQLAEKPEFKSIKLKDDSNETTLTTTDNGLNIGGDKITNVAAGEGDTDAVNIAQLKAAKPTVLKGTNVTSVVKTEGTGTAGDTWTVNANGTTVSAGSTAVSVTNPNGKDATTNISDFVVDLSDDTKAKLAKALLTEEVTAGDGITVNPTAATATKGASFEVVAKVDGKTIEIDPTSKAIKAKTVGLPVSADTGKVTAPTGDNAKALATAGDIATAINSTYHKVTNTNTDTLVTEGTGTAKIKAGDTITFEAGKNLSSVMSDTGLLKVSTKDDVVFNTVKVGDKKNPITIGTVGTGDKAKNVIGGLSTTLTDNSTKTSGKKPTSPTITNAASLGDVLNAGWNLQVGSVPADFVQPYDTVNFIGGNGVSVTEKADSTNEKTNIEISVATGAVGSDTNANDGTTTGTDGFVSGTQVSTAINNAYHTVKNTDTDNLVTKAEGSTKIKAGSDLTIEAGKNLASAMVDDSGLLQISTKDEVEFKKVTLKDGNNETVLTTTDNGLDVGGDKITNVAAGEGDTDAVNVKQLKASKEVVKSTDKTVTVVTTQNTDGANVFDLSIQVDDATLAFVDVDANDPTQGKKLAPKTTQFTFDNIADPTDPSKKTPTGTVTATTPTSLATAGDIATAINGAGFNVKTETGEGTKDQLITMGDLVIFDEGKNIDVVQANNKFTIKTKDDLTGLNSVILGNALGNDVVSLTTTGINAGNKKITNLAPGVNPTDAVNMSQLTTSLSDSAWNIAGNNKTKVGDVNSGEQVNFINGNGTISTVVADSNNFNVSYGIDADNTTITVDPKTKKVKAKTTTLTPSKTDGTVSAGDTTSLVTGDQVANAINGAGFKVKTETGDGTKDQLITMGDLVIFDEGKNIDVVQANNKFTIKTKENVEFKTIKLKDGDNETNLTSTSQGLSVGGDTITNVGSGLKDKDGNVVSDLSKANQTNAVNVGDLLSVSNEAKVKSVETVSAGNGVTVKPTDGAKGKDYNVSINADTDTLKFVDKKLAVNTGDIITDTDSKGKVTGKVKPKKGDEKKVANVADVADAINSAGWVVKTTKTDKKTKKDITTDLDLVTAGNSVNFVEGNGIVITPKSDANNSEIKIAANIDNKTIKFNDDGELFADIVIPEISKTTGTIVLTDDAENKAGTVKVAKDDAFLTAGETEKLINGSFHTVKATNNATQVKAKNGSVQISAGDTLDIVAGKNLNANMSDNGTLQLSTASDVEFDNVAVKKGLTVAPKANVDMGGNQIHHVAPGTKPDDGVNVSQLRQSNQNLYKSIDNVSKDNKAGIAGSAAIAMLGHARDSGQSAVSAGVAFHEGQGALAVGVSAWSDNGHWLIKGALAQDTQSQTTVGASATYTWD